MSDQHLDFFDHSRAPVLTFSEVLLNLVLQYQHLLVVQQLIDGVVVGTDQFNPLDLGLNDSQIGKVAMTQVGYIFLFKAESGCVV